MYRRADATCLTVKCCQFVVTPKSEVSVSRRRSAFVDIRRSSPRVLHGAFAAYPPSASLPPAFHGHRSATKRSGQSPSVTDRGHPSRSTGDGGVQFSLGRIRAMTRSFGSCCVALHRCAWSPPHKPPHAVPSDQRRGERSDHEDKRGQDQCHHGASIAGSA